MTAAPSCVSRLHIWLCGKLLDCLLIKLEPGTNTSVTGNLDLDIAESGGMMAPLIGIWCDFMDLSLLALFALFLFISV